MLSQRLLEVGSASTHLDDLLAFWSRGLLELKERTHDDADISEFNKNKLSTLTDSLILLKKYIADLPEDTVCTRYNNLGCMYEQWTHALDLAKGHQSNAAKAVVSQLTAATTLLYNYLSEEDSGYELLKLVNSARE